MAIQIDDMSMICQSMIIKVAQYRRYKLFQGEQKTINKDIDESRRENLKKKKKEIK
jgi:hypothetical protein